MSLPNKTSAYEESRNKLRAMEVESYSKILSVFRAKGSLNKDRRKLLKQIASFLNVSPELHRAEARKASNDKVLADISYRLTGSSSKMEWLEEGRRLVPVPVRLPHFTAAAPLADYIASVGAVGEKCIKLFNKTKVPANAANEQEASVEAAPESGLEKEWLKMVSNLYEKKRKKDCRDECVQTMPKPSPPPPPAPPPKGCSYCKRRKLLRKKKLEVKDSAEAPEQAPSLASQRVDSNNTIQPEEINVVPLPCGKKILVENTCDGKLDYITATIIAQEVEVETECQVLESIKEEESIGEGPCDGEGEAAVAEQSSLREEESPPTIEEEAKSPVPVTFESPTTSPPAASPPTPSPLQPPDSPEIPIITPDFTGLLFHSGKPSTTITPSMLDFLDYDESAPVSRIPRILANAQRRRGMKRSHMEVNSNGEEEGRKTLRISESEERTGEVSECIDLVGEESLEEREVAGPSWSYAAGSSPPVILLPSPFPSYPHSQDIVIPLDDSDDDSSPTSPIEGESEKFCEDLKVIKVFNGESGVGCGVHSRSESFKDFLKLPSTATPVSKPFSENGSLNNISHIVLPETVKDIPYQSLANSEDVQTVDDLPMVNGHDDIIESKGTNSSG